jgi:signal transduction histidine kinase
VIGAGDDRRIVVDFMLQPVFEDGRLVMVIPSATDITERKRMEDALTEADRRKDEFLAMLAHELRNPLAPVRTGVQTLSRLATDDRLRPVVTMIERQLRHLVRLVDDLLDVTRIVRGRVVLQKERVALRTIVEEAVEASKEAIDGGGHELVLDLPDEDLMLEVDETRMAQVFTNLLNNAAKYTPVGGCIRLEAKLDESQRQLVVRVADNGVGMSGRMLPLVFDLFTQAPRTLDRSEGGLGIGLSLVRHMVELHGGAVEATSPGPGQGSTFIVRIPVGEAAAGP